MKYPLGIQSFEKLRSDGYLYLDKTALVYDLAHSGSYYFLSRPRRFGKSLLASTLEAYFKGKKELFKGLAIEGLEQEWKTYPVLSLSLNIDNYNTVESLVNVLNNTIDRWSKDYDITVKGSSPSIRLANLIAALFEKTAQKVVVLIDEYDKPLLQNLDNSDLQSQIRNELKAFYGVLKPLDEYIRFGFLCGNLWHHGG